VRRRRPARAADRGQTRVYDGDFVPNASHPNGRRRLCRVAHAPHARYDRARSVAAELTCNAGFEGPDPAINSHRTNRSRDQPHPHPFRWRRFARHRRSPASTSTTTNPATTSRSAPRLSQNSLRSGPRRRPFLQERTDAFLRVRRRRVQRHHRLGQVVCAMLVELDLLVERLLADAHGERAGARD
jgi:hypothetical protein